MHWKDYPYLYDLEHLHDYVPGTDVHIFNKGEVNSTVKKFKHWEGIVSHCVSKGHGAEIAIAYDGKALVINHWEKANPTVMVETLESAVAFAKRFGFVKK